MALKELRDVYASTTNRDADIGKIVVMPSVKTPKGECFDNVRMMIMDRATREEWEEVIRNGGAPADAITRCIKINAYRQLWFYHVSID